MPRRLTTLDKAVHGHWVLLPALADTDFLRWDEIVDEFRRKRANEPEAIALMKARAALTAELAKEYGLRKDQEQYALEFYGNGFLVPKDLSRRIAQHLEKERKAEKNAEELGLIPDVVKRFPIAVLEKTGWLLPAITFFRNTRPLQNPFHLRRYDPPSDSILTRDKKWECPFVPIMTVEDQSVADMIEDALSEERPCGFFLAVTSDRSMRMGGGWRKRYPQYLFGMHVWEITADEALLDEEQLRLVFLDAIDRDRRKFERLRRKFSGQAGQAISAREAIPEEVRIFVWRRDEGKCTKCGSQERLEFDHIIPVAKGGSSTARNIQLLCERCNREKRDHI